ncbi:hypothetical protein OY671_007899, partial [Metschnikowia pulcherrima]
SARAPAEAETSSGTDDGAIVVTAQRREQKSQDVPSSVTAQSASQLEQRGIENVQASGQVVPSSSVSSAVGFAITYSRGVGSTAIGPGIETPVSIYVDGIYYASATAASCDFNNTSRIEVLKGPQGTSFGRNTQGGAINVIANQPVFDREYTVRGEIGSHGHRSGESIANEASSDTVAARSASRYTTVDGTTPNSASGGRDGWADVGAARATVSWTPGANTVVTVTGSYDQQKAAAPRFVWSQNPRFPQTASDPENKIDWKDSSGSVKVEHEFEHFTSTSSTSYSDSRSRQAFDSTDGSIYSAMTGRPASAYNVPYADYADIPFPEQSWHQEFRSSSPETCASGWTVGANYSHSSFRTDTPDHASPPSL